METLYLKREDIDPDKYILIPGTREFISEREMYKGENFDFEDSHEALEEDKLWMPPAELFMPFVRDARRAARGELILSTGEGKSLSEERTKDLSRYLSSDYNGGVFTWLNNAFQKGRGYRDLDVEIRQRRIGVDIMLRRSPLERTAEEGHVDFFFNSQGFPTKKSEKQDFMSGNNFYFFELEKNSVVWLYADSEGLGLVCDLNPVSSDSALGVFACAEGAVC